MSQILLAGIEAVILDLDDTLYPERQFAFSGFDAVAAQLRSQMQCTFDPAGRMRELFETEYRRTVFDQVLHELGLSPLPAQVASCLACYRSHEPRIELHPDAQRALQRWRGRFKLGLISDGYLEVQQRKVAALGLAHHLGTMILTDAWGRAFWKPHPRAFETMQQAMGCPPSACVYIADNLAKDFVAPGRLGWQTVQIVRADGLYAKEPAPPDGEAKFVIDSLDDVDISRG